MSGRKRSSASCANLSNVCLALPSISSVDISINLPMYRLIDTPTRLFLVCLLDIVDMVDMVLDHHIIMMSLLLNKE